MACEYLEGIFYDKRSRTRLCAANSSDQPMCANGGKDHRKDAIYFSNTYRADQSPIIIPIFRELRLNHGDMPHARLHESTVYITYVSVRGTCVNHRSSYRDTVPHNLSTPAGRSSLTATLIELQLQCKLDVPSGLLTS